MKKAILWDNDGILVDTEKYYYQATKEVLKQYGIKLTKEQYREYFLTSSHGAWHLALENGAKEEELEPLRNRRNQIYADLLLNSLPAIDGAEEVLKYLHQKIKMGIVTSSRKSHFEIIHSRTGFKKYIDFYLTRENYKNSKPDPEPYLKGIEVLGLNPSEIVAIEDSERGLEAAVCAGIDCWVIPTELTKKGNFSKAAKIFKSIKEVMLEFE